LAWDPARYLYVPDRSKESLAYSTQARDGYYLQPYRDAGGTWRTRWAYAAVSTPDAARPYRVVDAPTASGLWLTASQMSYVDPATARLKSGEFREDPNAAFVPKYGPPPKEFRLADYAWVGQRQLPVGCPYPYPVLPVPIADYTSGHWLDEDYVPSIPLPPPYDQTPWQCGVAKAPGKPHKGGEPPAPMTVEKVEKTPDPTNLITADASLGIPPPTGTAAPRPGGPGEKIAAIQTKLESVQAAQKALETKLSTEQDGAKRAALEAEIAKAKAEGAQLANDLDDATQEQNRATGRDRYAHRETQTIGGAKPRAVPPPGLPADPDKEPNPPPPPAPPPQTKRKCPPILGPDGIRIPDGSRPDDPKPRVAEAQTRGSNPALPGATGVGGLVRDPKFRKSLSAPEGSGTNSITNTDLDRFDAKAGRAQDL
jgi:hypothetical protein